MQEIKSTKNIKKNKIRSSFTQILFTFFLCTFLLPTNAQIVLNDDVYINVTGGTNLQPSFLVLEEQTPAGIIQVGTGGNIISEGQYNQLFWRIGNSNTGNYMVPFSNNTGDAIPINFSVSSGGVNGEGIIFSTYETNISNLPLPDGVNQLDNVANNTTGNGDFIYDRYWIANPNGYTTNPAFELKLGYTPGEFTGGLSFSGSNLMAQAYNDALNAWDSNLYGYDNSIDAVESIQISSSQLFSVYTLVENNVTYGTDVITACDSYTWIDGNTYTLNNNSATDTLTNAAGYDSIVTLDLTINNSNSGTDVITACDSYTWIDGNTYNSSNNTATHTLTNVAGCDSVVTLDLTINNSNSGTDVITACDSYTWIDGNTYSASNNMATHTLTNAAGCDSIVTLDLTINNSNTVTDVITACNSYTWIDGNTYNVSNNTATHTLTNVAGCDSIVTLDLTINNSNSGTDVITTCDSYTWIDGNTYTSDNNTATHTLTNAAGCDSVVTLDLTINTIDLSIADDLPLLTANQANANYQWLDCNDDYNQIVGENNQALTVTQNGNYAVEVTLGNCVDTSECYVVNTIGIIENGSNSQISLYPNPTKEKITLKLNKTYANTRVLIHDLTGRKVQESEHENTDKIELSIGNSAGVYYVSVLTEDKTTTIKVVKK